jgi:HTH-type transcriptional regulator/antitoxin HigA
MMKINRMHDMQSDQLDRALSRWPDVNGFVFIPRTPEEYEKLVSILDRIIDEVGENESHPLASLARFWGF